MKISILGFLIIAGNIFASETKIDTLTLRPIPVRTDKWIAKDKADHFMASAFLAGAGYTFASQELYKNHPQSQRLAFGFSISAGVLKELYDVHRGGPFSLKDLVADLAGTTVGLYLISIGR